MERLPRMRPPESSRTLLIVEDEPAMRAALREFVEAVLPGVLVVEADSACQARALWRARQPGAVLMDVHLPDGDGIALTADLRQELPQTAVIVVSAHAGRTYRERAAAAGAAGFVAKDDLYCDLPARIERAMGTAARRAMGRI